MKRITLALAAFLLTHLTGYGQFVHQGDGTDNIEIVNTNYTGISTANQGAAAFVRNVATLHVGSSQLNGATDGQSGGIGLFAILAGDILIDEGSTIVGGVGAELIPEVPIGGFTVLNGGRGISSIMPSQQLIISNATVTGGSGGTLNNSLATTQIIEANGGHGISRASGNLELQDGAVVSGGTGGTIVTTETVGDNSSVNGGVAILLTASSTLSNPGQVTVNGGAGGIFDAGDMSIGIASGGNALELSGSTSSFVLSNGTYVGGAGGTVTGADGSSAFGGDGIKIINASDVTIDGGTYTAGQGGTVNGAADADGYAINIADSTLAVSGGTFNGDMIFTGSGASTVDISGGELAGDIIFSGSGNSSVSLQNSWAGFSGMIVQTDGTADFSVWNDAHFNETYITAGSMNFTGQSFTHNEGDILAMSADSSVDFGGGFTSQSNSMIETVYDKGASSGSTITGTDLTFAEGTQWVIDGGDSIVENGDVILMAAASGTLSNAMESADVEYVGSSGSWLAGISVEAVGNNLNANYGYVAFEDALGVDDSTPFGQAMSDVSDFTDISNSSATEYEAIKSPNLTQEQADGYLRSAFSSPEMANTLIQAQQLYSDQIRDRSRSYLRFNNVGAPAAPAPEGAAGLVDIPATYQLWARAYGAFVSQGAIDEFVGYDATIGGAVVGADKRFDNLLFGLGGGYTRSDLKGNYGSNGEADTVYGSIYSTMNGESAFLELQGTVAYNDVETQGSQVTGGYHGEFDAGTASFFIGTGIGLPVMKDRVIFTPEVSLLTTYYARDGYTEKQTTDPNAGNWPDKVYDSYDEMSYLSALGGTLAMHERFEVLDLEMEFQPEIRAHWLHEFNDQMDNESYQMESLAGPYTPQQAVLQARQEDLIKLGLGVRFGKWDSDTFEFGLDLDAVFGDQYEAYIGSAKVMHRF